MNKKKKKMVRARYCKRCGRYFDARGVSMCKYCSRSVLIPKKVDPKKVSIEANPLMVLHTLNNNFPFSECFLTTACVNAMGLPDDCAELQTLRHFRDTYIAASSVGLNDIQEYYTIAPKVVSCISACQNATDLYREIYETIVRPCVNMINLGQFAEAYLLYKQKLRELCKRFLKLSD